MFTDSTKGSLKFRPAWATRTNFPNLATTAASEVFTVKKLPKTTLRAITNRTISPKYVSNVEISGMLVISLCTNGTTEYAYMGGVVGQVGFEPTTSPKRSCFTGRYSPNLL